MIKMVVFDMAGTTVDEDNIVYKTLHKCINATGYNVNLQQVLDIGAGNEKKVAIKKIIASVNDNCSDETIETIYTNFNETLQQAYSTANIFPQKGALELFNALKEKDIKIILNTGYNKTTALQLLDKINWQIGIHIDGLITASDVANSRPCADMILLAMQQSGITNPSEVAKIGDSIIDIEEGQNAGCGLSVGITTGAHTYEQLLSANPDAVINELNDLLLLV